ncbi:hypothetical protein [Flavobacterium sp. 3HN19-14]
MPPPPPPAGASAHSTVPLVSNALRNFPAAAPVVLSLMVPSATNAVPPDL